jgi:hypothetical protein
VCVPVFASARIGSRSVDVRYDEFSKEVLLHFFLLIKKCGAKPPHHSIKIPTLQKFMYIEKDKRTIQDKRKGLQ